MDEHISCEVKYAELVVAYTKLVNELDELRIDYINAIRERNYALSDLDFAQKCLEAERFTRATMLAKEQKFAQNLDGTLSTDEISRLQIESNAWKDTALILARDLGKVGYAYSEFQNLMDGKSNV